MDLELRVYLLQLELRYVGMSREMREEIHYFSHAAPFLLIVVSESAPADLCQFPASLSLWRLSGFSVNHIRRDQTRHLLTMERPI